MKKTLGSILIALSALAGIAGPASASPVESISFAFEDIEWEYYGQ